MVRRVLHLLLLKVRELGMVALEARVGPLDVTVKVEEEGLDDPRRAHDEAEGIGNAFDSRVHQVGREEVVHPVLKQRGGQDSDWHG